MTAAELEDRKARVLTLCNKPVALGGWLGTTYEDRGCIKFLKLAYGELDIDTGEDFSFFRDARQFRRVDKPQFGDVAVFKSLPFASYHVAMMLDEKRTAIQSAEQTNGVGKIHIDRYPWGETFKGFYRHKAMIQ